MAYDPSNTYAKYLLKKSGSTGCSGCSESNSECNDCSCCPPGLVAVYDDKGNHAGCLTPNDAELFVQNSFVCQDGYIRLTKADGTFLGCVSQDQWANMWQVVNP
jgi:hypothetical protein